MRIAKVNHVLMAHTPRLVHVQQRGVVRTHKETAQPRKGAPVLIIVFAARVDSSSVCARWEMGSVTAAQAKLTGKNEKGMCYASVHVEGGDGGSATQARKRASSETRGRVKAVEEGEVESERARRGREAAAPVYRSVMLGAGAYRQASKGVRAACCRMGMSFDCAGANAVRGKENDPQN